VGATSRGWSPKEVYKMFVQPSLLSAVPSGVMDTTTDFAPLFVGLVVVLGLSMLGLAFAIGVHDTRWAQRTGKKDSAQSAPAPQFPKAA
jgi:hypothetical protein